MTIILTVLLTSILTTLIFLCVLISRQKSPSHDLKLTHVLDYDELCEIDILVRKQHYTLSSKPFNELTQAQIDEIQILESIRQKLWPDKNTTNKSSTISFPPISLETSSMKTCVETYRTPSSTVSPISPTNGLDKSSVTTSTQITVPEQNLLSTWWWTCCSTTSTWILSMKNLNKLSIDFVIFKINYELRKNEKHPHLYYHSHIAHMYRM